MIIAIRRQGTIGLLVDQAVFPEEGCLIDFLGRPAWASKAPALLYRKTGVPIIPAFIYRQGKNHIIELHPQLQFSGGTDDESIKNDVQLYSRAIEQFITAHPVDWYWLHRRWKRAEGL